MLAEGVGGLKTEECSRVKSIREISSDVVRAVDVFPFAVEGAFLPLVGEAVVSARSSDIGVEGDGTRSVAECVDSGVEELRSNDAVVKRNGNSV